MKKINEKVKQTNFTKLTQKGISLIVLIITIIVIIILSTAVIVTISSNNPIDEANIARYESDRDNIQALFTNTVAKVMAKNLGTVNVTAGKINTVTSGVNSTTGEVSYTVAGAANTENSSGKIVFDKGENTDTIFYTGKKLPIYNAGDTKWYVDSEGEISLEVAGVKYGSGETVEVVAEPSAAAVAADPATYYGAAVTNYKTGDTTIDSQVEWQIFHSDGNNIYLIATDCIDGSLAPAGKGGTAPSFSNKCIWLYSTWMESGLFMDYNGSEDITDTRLQALNSKYFEYLKANNITSGEEYNKRAVAYLMDTSENVWGKFAGEDASYAIGTPTLELYFDSYNNKKGTSYRYRIGRDDTIGYQVSIDDGANWGTRAESCIDINDTQYILPSSGNLYGMWLSSPTAYHGYYLCCLGGSGGNSLVDYTSGGTNYGLRPIVCLNSNVALEAVDGGFSIVR